MAQNSPVWLATPDLRIGSSEGEVLLGRVSGLAAGPDGGVLVADDQAQQVMEFDSCGALIRTYGRPGQGPGEFYSPAYVGVRGDSVWVTDPAQRRVSWFTGTAKPLLTFQITESDYAAPWRLSMPRGPVAAERFAANVSVPPMVLTRMQVERLPIVAIDRKGRTVDTLEWRNVLHGPLVLRNPDNPWAGLVTRQPFGEVTRWTVLPDGTGIAVADVSSVSRPTLSVRVLDGKGKAVWDVSSAYRPKTLPQTTVRRVRENLVQRVLRARGPGANRASEARDIVNENLHIPDFLPTVTGIVATASKDVFVRREPAAENDPQRWTWFRAGRRVGDVFVPAEVEVRAASSREMWGVLRDDLDVEYVVRLTLAPFAESTRD